VLNQDFKEFIQSLNDNRVRYLVVGGYAVALHGHPRYTKDIDIWIELSPENAANMISALEAFGFASLGLKETDFLTPGQVDSVGTAAQSNRFALHRLGRGLRRLPRVAGYG
jgi:hypothetical protein